MATIAKPGALGPLHSHLKGLPLMNFSSSALLPKFGDSRLLPQLNVIPKHSRNASILPVIRAQGSPGLYFTLNQYSGKTYSWLWDKCCRFCWIINWLSKLIFTFALLLDYVPDSKFYKVEAILRFVLSQNLLYLLCFSFFACNLFLGGVCVLLSVHACCSNFSPKFVWSMVFSFRF